MAIDWDIPYKAMNAYDAERRTDSSVEAQGIENRSALQKLQDLGAQRAARPAIQQQVQAGDYQGAQVAALGTGDYDLAGKIGALHDDHRKQLAVQSDWMGRAANSLRSIPQEQRAAVFVGMAPTLTGHGFHPDELRGVDLSDEGLAGYIAMSQSVKDQLGTSLTQRRIDDVGQDNQRADLLAGNTIRNTDNVLEDRGARRGLVARGQDLTDSRGRYGIGVASGDRRRGQDMSATTSIRGQDVTDRRTREIAATRPTSSGRGSGKRITPNNPASMVPGTAAFPVTVTSPAQAKMLPPGTYFKNPQGKVMRR
jgi:hypothetical protein